MVTFIEKYKFYNKYFNRYLDYLLRTYLAHLNKIVVSFDTFFENKISSICFSEKINITASNNQQIKFDQDWNKGLQLMCNAFYKVRNINIIELLIWF